jgi:hypothetical protein
MKKKVKLAKYLEDRNNLQSDLGEIFGIFPSRISQIKASNPEATLIIENGEVCELHYITPKIYYRIMGS